ncbi:MAG: hypothetical protein GXP30_09820 [Verrucomicrobia bacterium]|nr:hypothetical protein [Verrucomicrobiota bacterium]
MTRILTFILAVTCFTAIADDKGASPVFKASDTKSITAKNGQKITVRGTVSTVRKSKGGANFINFANSEFYLITFSSDLSAFADGEPADLYQGKHLAVTGVVSIHKDKPQMKLLRPDMVKLISEDEPLSTPSITETHELSKQKAVTPPAKLPTSKKKSTKTPVDPKKYFK